jgi:hypothetical protein
MTVNYCGTGPDSLDSWSDPANLNPSDAELAQDAAFNPFPAPVVHPTEPAAGTVLGFTKQFTEDGQVYSYVALSIDTNKWYLSGPRQAGHPFSWGALLGFIGGPTEWAGVGVVASWTPMA